MAAAFGVGPGAPRYGERRHGDDTDRKRGRLLGGLSQVRAGVVRVRREGQGGAGDATTGGTAVGHDAGGPRGARGRERSVRRRVGAGDAGQWWGPATRLTLEGQRSDGRVSEPEDGGEARKGQDELGEETDQAHPVNRV